ncbi:MAG: phage holin family protein [Candidatus Baltobacteraceae bacterium]
MGFLISWLLNAISLAILVYLIAPLFHIGVHADGVTAVVIAALVFGIVNAIVRPLATFISIPLIILTLGLFLFVLNGLLLWLVGAIVPGFHVAGFWASVWGAIWLGIISWVVNAIGLRTAAKTA